MLRKSCIMTAGLQSIQCLAPGSQGTMQATGYCITLQFGRGTTTKQSMRAPQRLCGTGIAESKAYKKACSHRIYAKGHGPIGPWAHRAMGPQGHGPTGFAI